MLFGATRWDLYHVVIVGKRSRITTGALFGARLTEVANYFVLGDGADDCTVVLVALFAGVRLFKFILC